jgi:hypothetical protein
MFADKMWRQMKASKVKTSRQRKKFSLKELSDIGNFGTINRKSTRNSSKPVTGALSPTNDSVGIFSARTQAGTAESSRIASKQIVQRTSKKTFSYKNYPPEDLVEERQ